MGKCDLVHFPNNYYGSNGLQSNDCAHAWHSSAAAGGRCRRSALARPGNAGGGSFPLQFQDGCAEPNGTHPSRSERVVGPPESASLRCHSPAHRSAVQAAAPSGSADQQGLYAYAPLRFPEQASHY